MRSSMLISLLAVGCGEKAGVSVALTEADADCTWYNDADGDGYGSAVSVQSCKNIKA